jgi:hypothetical protein
VAPPSPRSLRGRLDAAGPPLPRKTWPSLIRLLRGRKKRTGEAPRFVTGDGELQRALAWEARGDAELDRDVLRLHDLLWGLHVASPDDEESQERAARADALLGRLTPRLRVDPVPVIVSGWHRSIPGPIREAVLGRSEASLSEVDPVDAAVLHHELAGLDLGGSRLRVKAVLLKGEVLPAAPRSRRAGPQRRDREGPWLPHVDEVGRWSATPWEIAKRHGELLADAGVGSVIDLFCGCGGDAIGFAAAGLDVVACERDAGRAGLARRNVATFDIPGRVEVTLGDGLALLPTWSARHPGAALYLDPPWGSADGQETAARRAVTWAHLLEGAGGAVDAVLDHAGPLLLKLPRDFDLATLPDPARWDIHWQMGDPDHGAERIVKVISALRRA